MSDTAAAIGCLIGTAVGDALGLPYEGLSQRRASRMLGEPDRHRFLLRHGMISDDTEHTCLVARALIRSGGDPETFAREMARGLRFWILALPAGVGLATARACIKLLAGYSADSAGVFSAGNGPAMRSAILGVHFEDLHVLKEFVARNTRITHTDPKAEYGALSIALAAYLAKTKQNIEPHAYLRQLQEMLASRDAAEFLDFIEQAVHSVADGTTTFEFAEQLGLSSGVGGYVYHCVPVVLHCWLCHQSDFRQAVTTIIQCGGDTDTNAAMVGGIVGARVGVGAIPREWIANLVEWPMSVEWMTTLAEHLAEPKTSGPSRKPKALFWAGTVLRNLVFLLVVLFHGFRRLLPPY